MPLYTTRSAFWWACNNTVPFSGSNGIVLATTQTINYSFSDPDWVAFHCDTGLAFSGGPSCARQFCASQVSKLGYPWMCGTGVSSGGYAASCLFYSVTWPGTITSNGPDRAHRNCTSTPCGDASGGYANLQTNWNCECLYCGTGANVTWDPVTQLCYVCPAGMCYCDGVGDCVNCTPPPCNTQLACYWDTQGCAWHCDTPTCPTGEEWSNTSCSCVTPPPPPPPPPPPCATELHCVLNTTTNSWDCDPPPSCPTGQSWSSTTCACEDNCTPGYCWCIGAGSCVPCAPPLCHVELHCSWSMDDCTWHCDNPTVPGYCADGYHWSYASCACVLNRVGLATLHDKEGRYYRAVPESTGIQVYRAQFDVPPYVLVTAATSNGADNEPVLFLDERQRLHLMFSRSPDVLETVSTDFSKHWSTPVTLFAGADNPRGRTHSRNKIRIRAAYRSGNLVGRKEQPDGTLGTEFTFLDTAGGPLSVDDAPWDLSPSPIGPKAMWDLEVSQSGNIHTWRSFDNCLHWELVT